MSTKPPNHTSQERLPHELYGVEGVGVVGSYAKAKAGHYNRSHKYWAITKWSDECTAHCHFKARDRYDAHFPKGAVEDPSFPHFRTKLAACTHLLEWANANLPGGPFKEDPYGISPRLPEESP